MLPIRFVASTGRSVKSSPSVQCFRRKTSIDVPTATAVKRLARKGRTHMTIRLKILGKQLGLGAALAATALVAVAPAEARDRYRDRDDDAAIAIGAGIIGLAVGAAIADRSDDRYYDRRWYGERRYVTVPNRREYYYYYEGRPNRYYRDRHYDRYYAPYHRDRWYGRRGYYRDVPPPPPPRYGRYGW